MKWGHGACNAWRSEGLDPTEMLIKVQENTSGGIQTTLTISADSPFLLQTPPPHPCHSSGTSIPQEQHFVKISGLHLEDTGKRIHFSHGNILPGCLTSSIPELPNFLHCQYNIPLWDPGQLVASQTFRSSTITCLNWKKTWNYFIQDCNCLNIWTHFG